MPINQDLFNALYKKRLSDRKIAKALGVSQTTIYLYRKENNIPPAKERTALSSIDGDRLEELFARGMNCKQAAEELHVPVSSVYYWRRSMDKARSQKKNKDMFMELYNNGAPDAVIAEKMGMPVDTVAHRRRFYKLPPNHAKNDKKDRFVELRGQGMPYSKIAKELDVPVNRLFHWANSLGLDTDTGNGDRRFIQR